MRIINQAKLVPFKKHTELKENLSVHATPEQMGMQAAKMIASIIRENNKQRKKTVLSPATGSTPIPVYQALIKMYESKKANEHIDFSNVISFNLDEYIGLPAKHKESYRNFMQEQLFDHINIDPDNIHFPNPKDPDAYDDEICKAGGVDIQILGIGHNGHIGFNEPDSSFNSKTRVVTLDERTVKANARFFENDIDKVPTKAITMGLKTIMGAKHCVLLATGEGKADIISNFFKGPVTTKLPATALRQHPQLTIILDKAAASKLDIAPLKAQARQFGESKLPEEKRKVASTQVTKGLTVSTDGFGNK